MTATLERWVGRSVISLALGAFVLSFEKLYSAALSAGIHPWLAWIYGINVEGVTTISTLAAFLTHGRRGAWYPWIVGMTGFGLSLWVNSGWPIPVPDGVVRGVPVVCIPLMVHMWIIIRRVRIEAEAEAEAEAARVAAVDLDTETGLDIIAPGPQIDPRVDQYLNMADHAQTEERRQFWRNRAAEILAAA